MEQNEDIVIDIKKMKLVNEIIFLLTPVRYINGYAYIFRKQKYTQIADLLTEWEEFVKSFIYSDDNDDTLADIRVKIDEKTNEILQKMSESDRQLILPKYRQGAFNTTWISILEDLPENDFSLTLSNIHDRKKISMKEARLILAGCEYRDIVYFIMTRYLDVTRNYNQHPEYTITVNGCDFSCANITEPA